MLTFCAVESVKLRHRVYDDCNCVACVVVVVVVVVVCVWGAMIKHGLVSTTSGVLCEAPTLVWARQNAACNAHRFNTAQPYISLSFSPHSLCVYTSVFPATTYARAAPQVQSKAHHTAPQLQRGIKLGPCVRMHLTLW